MTDITPNTNPHTKQSGRLSADVRFAIALACLIALLPSLVFDLEKIEFLSYYSNATFYITAKLLIWFLLPATVLIALSPLKYRSKFLYRGLLFYFTSGLYFYLSASLLQSLILGAILTAAWIVAESVFCNLWKLILVSSLLFLGVFSTLHFTDLETEIVNTSLPANSPPSNSSPSKVLLSQSIYVIVFDELSKQVVYKNGTVSDDFPNFKRLAENSLSATNSTTNYDVTERVLPSLLAGKLFDLKQPLEEKLMDLNLFDYFTKDNLYVWSAMIPYCTTVERKAPGSYCLDSSDVSESDAFFHALWLDFRRLVAIYITDLGAAITLAGVTGSPDTEVPKAAWGKNPKLEAVADYLHALLSQKHGDVWLNFIDFDLKVIDDLLANIGKHKKSLYFYHSSIAHAPFVADKDLNLNKEVRFHAFPTARREEDLKRINERYIKHVQAADTLLGKLLDKIQQDDPESIIIVTSDHGAQREFAQTKGLRNSGLLLPDMVEILYFVNLPQSHQRAKNSFDYYQHIDFLPTLLDLVRHPIPEGLDGNSVFSGKKSEFYFASGQNVYRHYDGKAQTPDNATAK